MFKGYKQDRFGVVDGIITCNCNLHAKLYCIVA